MSRTIATGSLPTTVEGLLVSALDMEDEIAHSVYVDYMDQGNWPEGISDENFERIRERLITLLKDTERHRKIVKSLQAKLGHDHG